MRRWLAPVVLMVVCLANARAAAAQSQDSTDRPTFFGATFFASNAWANTIAPLDLRASLAMTKGMSPRLSQTPQTAARPIAFEYSDGYRLRAKIHRIASFATLPLFAAEGWVGQSLYSNPTDTKKSAHLAIATGIGALFAINSVTGVWNLVEARHDPNGRTRRTLHGILMLAADAGFLATAMTAPESEFDEHEGGGTRGGGSRSLHRGIAFTSIGLATASYLIMLFGR